jgi:YQGE family putative transporter
MMVLLMRKNNVWLRSLYSYLVIGLLQGIMLFVPNLLLYQVIPREDIIGYLGVLFSGTAMLTAYAMGRWSQSDLLNRYTTVAAIGFTLAALMIIWKMDPLIVIIFVMLYQIFTVIQNNSMTNYYYHLTSKLPLKGALRVESIILREVFVNIGRVIGIGTMLIFVDQMNGPSLPIVLLVFSIIQFSLMFLNWKRAGDEG